MSRPCARLVNILAFYAKASHLYVVFTLRGVWVRACVRARARVCVCVSVCERACVHACMRVCVFKRRAYVHVCLSVSMCPYISSY